MTKLEYDADSIFDLEVGNSVRLGDVSYKIKKFSRGGMGFIIYLCQSNSRPSEKFSIHGQRVVIKAALGDDSGNIQNLFLRELTIWAGFRNRNIINLNEIIQIDNVYAAAMNWCHGSLREYISNNEKLAPEISFYVIDSIISALSYACRNHSVFHLDLKPENVLYDKRYEPYGLFMVSDWGISSIRGELAKHANLSNRRRIFFR